MKKLLIAMTAAAVGTCAWAEGEQTLLSESFTGWTLTDNTWWSYSAAAVDGELTLTDGEDAKLSLNTGSKVLTGSFTSDDQPKAIGNGLYFNAKVTFKDPSDTLPTLGEADKFALVVLDNVESIDAGYTTTPATNLWVIAKYGESGQRAYQLDVEVDSKWLASEHEIVVKAYDNVMASGNCAGFLVMVDEIVCTVFRSCAIENNVINFGSFCRGNNFEDGAEYNLGYLGYPQTAILASVQKRYADAQLILSNVPRSDTLASVDFQGQGVIDDVSLATTGADFGADALVFTVEVSDGVTLTSDATVSYSAAGETKNITFTLANGWVLKGIAKGLEPDANGVYTYVYTTVADNNQVVKIEAFEPKAYVGDTAYETFADALAAVTANGGTLKLSAPVNVAYLDFSNVNEVTLDLNGQTITGTSAEYATIVNTGVLKIIDSSELKNGTVAATVKGSIENNASLEIVEGIFSGAVTTYVLEWDEDGELVSFGNAETLVSGGTFDGEFVVTAYVGTSDLSATASVSGGKFKVKPADSVLADDLAFSTEATNGYYSVVTASTSNYPESDKLVNSETELNADQKKAVEATFNAIAGEATDKDAAVTNYINTVYGQTIPADALIGAKSVDISVKFNLPLMKTETPTIEVAPATVTADSGNAAAFEFTIKDGNTALTLSQVAKVLEMVQYVADLANEWAAATATDVDTSVNAGKAKVELKAKTGVNKGFMRLKLR